MYNNPGCLDLKDQLTDRELAEMAFTSMIKLGEELTTFEDAWNHPNLEDQEKWHEGIHKEFGA